MVDLSPTAASAASKRGFPLDQDTVVMVSDGIFLHLAVMNDGSPHRG